MKNNKKLIYALIAIICSILWIGGALYYQKCKDEKIAISERNAIENKLIETKKAKETAEEKTKIADSNRKIAEEETQLEIIEKNKAIAKAKQEETERKLKEKELSEKEAEEIRMNADNDNDGLTFRRELELGTSDLDLDSDNDGINDNEDINPAGGGRSLAQHFEWEFEGKTWTWDLSIHEDWYEYYKNKPRTQHGLEYITENDPFVQGIAKKLKEISNKENYHLTSFIVSFVQSLSYVDDSYIGFDDYPKYPIETFIEKNGDCEDTSYLFASLVQAAGRGALLIEFHNHMGVGIKANHSQSGYYYPIKNDWYYYYETTGIDWFVGDLPDDYHYENAKLTRILDNSIHYSYPKYIKPCNISPIYSGYYYDNINYYSDSQCTNITYCLRYDKFYYNPKESIFYWDSSCRQIAVSGCSKSTDYPGYFHDSIDLYSDSQCTFKATICRSSPNYSDTYYNGYYDFWDSNCRQKVVLWCVKSIYYPGYFYNSINSDIYVDSECLELLSL